MKEQDNDKSSLTDTQTTLQARAKAGLTSLEHDQSVHGDTVNQSLTQSFLKIAADNFNNCIVFENEKTLVIPGDNNATRAAQISALPICSSSASLSDNITKDTIIIHRQARFQDTLGYMETTLNAFFTEPKLKHDIKISLQAKLAEPLDAELDYQIIDSLENGQAYSTRWELPLNVVLAVVIYSLEDIYSGKWVTDTPDMEQRRQERDSRIKALCKVIKSLVQYGLCHTDWRVQLWQCLVGYDGIIFMMEKNNALLAYICKYVYQSPALQQALSSIVSFRDILLPWILQDEMPLALQAQIFSEENGFERALETYVTQRYLIEFGINTRLKEHEKHKTQIANNCLRTSLIQLPCHFTPLLAEISRWYQRAVSLNTSKRLQFDQKSAQIITWLRSDFCPNTALSSRATAPTSYETPTPLTDENKFFLISELFDAWDKVNQHQYMFDLGDVKSTRALDYFYHLEKLALDGQLFTVLTHHSDWLRLRTELTSFHKTFLGVQKATAADFIQHFLTKWYAANTPNEEGYIDNETIANLFCQLAELKLSDENKPTTECLITICPQEIDDLFDQLRVVHEKATTSENLLDEQNTSLLEIYHVNRILLHAATTPIAEWTDALAIQVNMLCEFIEKNFNNPQHAMPWYQQHVKEYSYPPELLQNLRQSIAAYETKRAASTADITLDNSAMSSEPHFLWQSPELILGYLVIMPHASPNLIRYLVNMVVTSENVESYKTHFIYAINNNALELIKALLTYGWVPQNYHLQTAIECQHISVIKLLLDAMPAAQYIDDKELIPAAVNTKNIYIVEILLNKCVGFTSELHNSYLGNRHPLYLAITTQQHEMVELLLKYGIGLNSDYEVPMAESRPSSITKLTIKPVSRLLNLVKTHYGLEFMVKTTKLTPLMLAIMDYGDALRSKHSLIGSKEKILTVIAEEENFNAQDSWGQTALHWAIRESISDPDIIDILLAKTHLDAYTSTGASPLMTAITYENEYVLQQLLGIPHPVFADASQILSNAYHATAALETSNKADNDMAWQDILGRTALHLVLYIQRNNLNRHFMLDRHSYYCNLIRALVLRGADVNLPDNNQNTSLMLIIASGHSFTYVRNNTVNPAYLNRKPSISLANNHEDFPDNEDSQDIADEFEQTHAIFLPANYLLNANIQDKNGITPLMLAIKLGNLAMAKRLITADTNLNLQDNEGRTALHYLMCELGQSNESIQCQIDTTKPSFVNILALLLLHGANINIRDENGLTPFMFLLISYEKYTMEYHICSDYAGILCQLPLALSLEPIHFYLDDYKDQANDMSLQFPLQFYADIVSSIINIKQLKDIILKATYSGDLDTILGLPREVMIGIPDCYGINPIQVASAQGHLEVVAALLDLDISNLNAGYMAYDSHDNNALYHALLQDRDDIVVSLLRKGACPLTHECPLYVSGTPIDNALLLAARKNKLPWLLAEAGITPLMFAIILYAYQEATPGVTPDASPLLDCIATSHQAGSISQQDNSQKTALQWALRLGIKNEVIVKTLLAADTGPQISAWENAQLPLTNDAHANLSCSNKVTFFTPAEATIHVKEQITTTAALPGGAPSA